MSGQTNLYAFAEPDKLAAAVRAYVIKCQNSAFSRHDVFKVAVSGGSLPKTLAQALAKAPTSDSKDDQVQWDKWEIFYADERAVPLDHEDSNHRLLQQEILDKLPAKGPRPTVFPIDPGLLEDTQELADAYEKTLVKQFARMDSIKVPIFDLILLGCGPDGHTCSLFPGHALLRECTAWVAPIEDSPKPPLRRVTLTMPVLACAVQVAFVATGAGKKEVMRSIFEGAEGVPLPAALVNEKCADRCSWFVDDAAVEAVNYPRRTFSP